MRHFETHHAFPLLKKNVSFKKADFTKKKRFASIFAEKPMGFISGEIRKKADTFPRRVARERSVRAESGLNSTKTIGKVKFCLNKNIDSGQKKNAKLRGNFLFTLNKL